jgi:hypothetical protein
MRRILFYFLSVHPSSHFDEELDPDPHRSEQLDSDPHQNGKRDPDPDPTVVYLIRNTAFMPMLPANTYRSSFSWTF